MATVQQSMLVWMLIAGPILGGGLAWLARHARIRSSIVFSTAFITIAAGIWLALSGPMQIQGNAWSNQIVKVLEVIMIGLFLTVGIVHRIWLVIVISVVQGGMFLIEFFSHTSAPPQTLFLMDSLSTVLVLIVSTIGSMIVIYGTGYMSNHEHHSPPTTASTGRFFFFLTGFLGLMNGLVLADNLKWLSIFWEGTTLCSFFLIGHDGTDEARNNARRAIAINALGGLALSLGAFAANHHGEVVTLSGLVRQAQLLPIVLVLIASFTKSAQLPFQSWLLGAMVAPTPVSALLHSSTMVKAGSYLVLRLAPAFEGTPLASIVAFSGAFTFAVTSAMAISQSNAKKVLAYSTIANLGLIVACSGINTPLAYTAALFILIYHAISKALLFLCVGTIEQQIGSRHIDDMSGIMFKMPLTTSLTAAGMVSMMAPPFGMLTGKWMAIASAGHTPLVLMLLVLGSALTIFFWGKWMGRIITTAYHDTYKFEPLRPTMKISMTLLAVIVILGAACSTQIYQHYLSPMASQALANVTLQPDSERLLKSVDEFMSWSIYLVMGAIIIVSLVSLIGLRKVRPVMPFLCGENYRTGSKTFEFRSTMDEGVMAHVTSYYFAPWFGEKNMTQWANPVAILILLSLFARIGVL